MSRETNFYYSFLVLPRPQREALIAVWDFCRAVDDAVDCPDGAAAGGTTPAEVLAGWRDELAACYDGGVPRTEQGRALQPIVRRYGLPRRAFEDLVDGVEMDLAIRQYPTFGDLYQYCYRVASTVGLICIEIFGYRDLKTRDYAIELGIALQLTNIARDLGADLESGRLYIPLEDMERFGCSEGDLRSGVMSGPVRSLVRHQCERARSYYERARTLLPRQDRRRLVAAEIMRAIYHALLERIERVEYNVFAAEVRLSRPRRAAIAATTWARTMLNPF